MPDSFRRYIGGGIAIACAVLLIYGQTRGFGFIDFDDDIYVFNNPHIADGLTWTAIRWAFSAFYAANWHPLTWLSYMAEISVFGVAPGVHHVTNVVIHCGNAILVFIFLARTTGMYWPSFVCGLLLAVHPIHVESVAWISQRKDVLSLFFGLCTMIAYADFAILRRKSTYIAALVCYIMGVLAKPTLVTLPFLLLLLDYWPLERWANPFGGWKTARPFLLEKLPFFFLSAASSVMTILAQSNDMAIRSLAQHPMTFRIGNAIVSLAGYLDHWLWPTRLGLLYPYPEWIAPWKIIAGGSLVLALAAIVIWGTKSAAIRMGWFWFLGALVPMIGIVQVGEQSMADRYAYLPMIGLSIALAFGIQFAIGHRRRLGRLVWAGIGAWCLGLSLLAHVQVGLWRASIPLLSHTIAITRKNVKMESNIAVSYYNAGRMTEALAHARRAYQYEPDNVYAAHNFGKLLIEFGDHDTGRQVLLRNIKRHPNYPKNYFAIGASYIDEGAPRKALAIYQTARKRFPGNPWVSAAIGGVYLHLEQYDRAFDWFMAAWRKAPGLPGLARHIAASLVALGKETEAKTWLARIHTGDQSIAGVRQLVSDLHRQALRFRAGSLGGELSSPEGP